MLEKIIKFFERLQRLFLAMLMSIMIVLGAAVGVVAIAGIYLVLESLFPGSMSSIIQ